MIRFTDNLTSQFGIGTPLNRVQPPEDGGPRDEVRFHETRPFWAVWKPRSSQISESCAAERVARGKTGRLKVQSGNSELLLPLRSLEDLREAKQDLVGRPGNEIHRCLSDLAEGGWRFKGRHRKLDGEIGLYGAYNAVTDASFEISHLRMENEERTVGFDPASLAKFSKDYLQLSPRKQRVLVAALNGFEDLESAGALLEQLRDVGRVEGAQLANFGVRLAKENRIKEPGAARALTKAVLQEMTECGETAHSARINLQVLERLNWGHLKSPEVVLEVLLNPLVSEGVPFRSYADQVVERVYQHPKLHSHRQGSDASLVARAFLELAPPSSTKSHVLAVLDKMDTMSYPPNEGGWNGRYPQRALAWGVLENAPANVDELGHKIASIVRKAYPSDAERLGKVAAYELYPSLAKQVHPLLKGIEREARIRAWESTLEAGPLNSAGDRANFFTELERKVRSAGPWAPVMGQSILDYLQEEPEMARACEYGQSLLAGLPDNSSVQRAMSRGLTEAIRSHPQAQTEEELTDFALRVLEGVADYSPVSEVDALAEEMLKTRAGTLVPDELVRFAQELSELTNSTQLIARTSLRHRALSGLRGIATMALDMLSYRLDSAGRPEHARPGKPIKTPDSFESPRYSARKLARGIVQFFKQSSEKEFRSLGSRLELLARTDRSKGMDLEVLWRALEILAHTGEPSIPNDLMFPAEENSVTIAQDLEGLTIGNFELPFQDV